MDDKINYFHKVTQNTRVIKKLNNHRFISVKQTSVVHTSSAINNGEFLAIKLKYLFSLIKLFARLKLVHFLGK